MKKVSIQGIIGAFHQEAAINYFNEELEIIPNLTFLELVKSVEDGSADYGIIAIENTISGTINQNLRLISEHQVQICGEQKMRIVQNLGVLKGTRVEDLKEVRSHYMAINQCRNYFSSHPAIRLVEEEDTALSAKNVADLQLKDVGAIGSIEAMNHYGLEVLEESIESNKLNFTRFFIIKKLDKNAIQSGNKVTLQLTLNHEVGSLANLLSGFQSLRASLTKIESAPIIGQPWNYQFFLEAELQSDTNYGALLELLHAQTVEFDILGRYESHNS